MSSYSVRPLSDRTWLRPDPARRPSMFRAGWLETEWLLCTEVGEWLNGRDLVIEVDVEEQDIRNDGRVRAGAKADSPAVVVAFDTTKHGPMLYRCDTFTTHHNVAQAWQHNVRAIAKTLEALRTVDRYGATDTGQQYTGFKALPAGRAMPTSSHMTRTAAAELLESIAVGDEGALRNRSVEQILTDSDTAKETWRHARAMAHPDRRDGDRTLWDKVEQAGIVLGVAS